MLFVQLKYYTQIIFAVLLFLPTISYAQTGTFDVRFLIHSVDCAAQKLYFDIQLRADEPGQEFYLADQNYRFSFYRDVLDDLQIVEELDISGFIPGGGGSFGFSLYSIHTLVGTIDTIASYNLELQGGDGVFITDTDYFSVGRASMDIVNFNAIIGLRFHRNVAENFPPVFVGQIYEGMRIPTNEGSYLDYFHDFTGICTNEIPLTSDDSGTTIPNETITICLLDNDIDPENKFDLNSLSFISTPPTSEGAVSLDVGTGCLTFVPNEDFTGDVTPFEYEICDAGKYIPAYKGDANALPVPTPVVDNPDILVTPSACNRATVYITVEDMATDITMASQDFDLNISPNPADEMLNISYTLPKKADVSIALWNVLGQRIKHLKTETLQTGKYNKSFDVSHLSKGNYFIVLSVDGEVCSKNVKIK